MGRKINLDALVGEDVELVWKGVTYPVPADLPTDVLLDAIRLEAKVLAAGDDADGLAVVFESQAALLDRIVQVRTPGASIASEMGPSVVSQAIGALTAAAAGPDVEEAVASDGAATATAAVEAALGADPPTPATLAG